MLSRRGLAWTAAFVVVPALLAACGGPESSGGDAGGGLDATPDARIPTCVVDEDCDDGTFCNGAERCMPGATDADDRGCVAAADEPCGTGEECREDTATCDTLCADADRDGHGAVACGGDDCDDADPDRYPGNVEVCDASAADEDCNPETFGFLDADGDGSAAQVCCNVVDGGDLLCGQDCNDGDSTVHPGAGDAPPLYCDGIDNDCSGAADEGCPCVEGDTQECGSPAQLMRIGLCRPGTQVCSGGTYTDACIGAIAPAEEICDTLDNDCDGTTDEGVLRTYYPDVDGDRFGATGGTPTTACSAPPGYASGDTDCDDALGSVNPAAIEICNGIDDDCAGGIDDGALRTFYLDADHDSFGLDGTTTSACTAPPGYSDRGGDCDDSTSGVSPSSAETCNGRDDNCDGTTDPGCACTDGSTQPCGPTVDTGECAFGVQTCLGGAWGGCVGAVLSTAETCNGRDDDCDGTSDDGVTVSGCHRDGDGDGHGTGGATTQCLDASRAAFGSCPVGWVNDASDCNDGVSAIRPGATEICDGIDQDCDGTADDGATIACYVDADGDAHGIGASVQRCADAARTMFGGCPSGYTNVATDCNDASAAIRPGATEACNGIDDDCDGTTDELLRVSCYVDGDADGFGAGAASMQCRDDARIAQGSCPVGYSNVATDCNDTLNPVRPGAPEACNGIDDDCDGAADEMVVNTYYRDADADGYGVAATTATACSAPAGYVAASGDCNDARGDVHPGASEVCDGADNDCDGTPDDGALRTYYRDADADLYGSSTTTTQACSAPVGYVENSLDCVDTNSAVRPTATELCNTFDDDCDGMTNEAPATGYCAAGYPLAADVASWACGGPGSACSIGGCASGHADCDGIVDDGCEVDTQTDPTSCGTCGRACGTGAGCAAGACATIVDIYAGDNTTCARWSTGHVSCWGANSSGMLGTGSDAPVRSLVPVPASVIADATRTSMGGQHHCFATATAHYCFGANGYGETGDGTTVSPRLDARYAGGAVRGLDADGNFTCMIPTAAGAGVRCWGSNAFGQIGTGSTAVGTYTTPQSVNFGGLTTANTIALGGSFACAGIDTGSIACWGNGQYGTLGNGMSGAGYLSALPVVVRSGGAALDFGPSTDIAGGTWHACAVNRTSGTLYCWGRNDQGQLGDGSLTLRSEAVAVAGTGWSQVGVGYFHSCGRRGAQVYCWGDDSQGALGNDATLLDRPTPQPVTLPGGLGATDIAVGYEHACALTNATPPTVYCWGNGISGQLGNGGTSDAPTPVLVTGLAPTGP